MTSPYIFTFNETLGTRQVVLDALDRIPEVTYWYATFPFGVLLTSTLSAFELAERIERLIPSASRAMWIIAAIDPHRVQGRLYPAGWHLINHPENPRMPPKG